MATLTAKGACCFGIKLDCREAVGVHAGDPENCRIVAKAVRLLGKDDFPSASMIVLAIDVHGHLYMDNEGMLFVLCESIDGIQELGLQRIKK